MQMPSHHLPPLSRDSRTDTHTLCEEGNQLPKQKFKNIMHKIFDYSFLEKW
jgi:hypothetical protein